MNDRVRRPLVDSPAKGFQGGGTRRLNCAENSGCTQISVTPAIFMRPVVSWASISGLIKMMHKNQLVLLRLNQIAGASGAQDVALHVMV